MGINKNNINKYEVAYNGLKEISPAIIIPNIPLFDSSYEWWLPILSKYVPGVREGFYEISTFGRVYTHTKSPKYPNGGIMNPSINHHGYYQINLLSIDGRKLCCKIARLVMLHFKFIPGCYLLEVDHLNGNKSNNTIWNLEWVTPQENTHRAINNGFRPVSRASNSSHLLTNDEAHNLYNRAVNGEDYMNLASEYNVSKQYIKDLVHGTIRPYIAGKYYNDREHIEMYSPT